MDNANVNTGDTVGDTQRTFVLASLVIRNFTGTPRKQKKKIESKTTFG